MAFSHLTIASSHSDHETTAIAPSATSVRGPDNNVSHASTMGRQEELVPEAFPSLCDGQSGNLSPPQMVCSG